MALDFTCRAMRQARSRSRASPRFRRSRRRHGPRRRVIGGEVGSSHQHTATGGSDVGEGVDDRLSIGQAVGSSAQARVQQDAQVRFGGEDGGRVGLDGGSDDDLQEERGQMLGQRGVHRSGHRHDAAEGTHRVAGERPLPGA